VVDPDAAAPDISIIVGMADYPAAVVHSSYDNGDPNASSAPAPTRRKASRSASSRAGPRADHTWWGTAVYGGPYLDRIEYIDFGTDPAAWLAAIESDEIDVLYESVGEFIDIMDGLGLGQVRGRDRRDHRDPPNQLAEVNGMRPYEDVRVRRRVRWRSTTRLCWSSATATAAPWPKTTTSARSTPNMPNFRRSRSIRPRPRR
jgi:peptide/nickel transport system substrate-binding protein